MADIRASTQISAMLNTHSFPAVRQMNRKYAFAQPSLA
jgi:hypothetical protein